MCRRRLAVGAALVRLFVVTRAAGRPTEPVPAPDGTRLTDHAQRPTTDASVCGTVRVGRHAVTALGQDGRGPLDAARRLPARGSSDRRREGAVEGTPDASDRARPTVLDRLLGRSLRGHALEPGVTAAGAAGPTFYAPPAAPPAPGPGGPLLVGHAEGQGVPRGQPPPQPPPGRLGQGQPRGQKTAAVVTGLDPLRPDPRSPQAGGAARRQAPGRPAPAARPRPEGQARRATRAGQAGARRRLAPRVAPRDGPHSQHRVARPAGAAARPQQVMRPGAACTWILDSIHAPESGWDPATALLGASQPPRVAGLRAYLQPLLAGPTAAGLTALAAEAPAPRARRPHGRPSGARSATPSATARSGAPMRTWHGAGRLALASSQAPGGLWCRMAGSRPAGVGRKQGRRQGSTGGRCASTVMGIALGRVIGKRTIHDSMAARRRGRSRRKARHGSGRRDQPALHSFWSHSKDFLPRRPSSHLGQFCR